MGLATYGASEYIYTNVVTYTTGGYSPHTVTTTGTTINGTVGGKLRIKIVVVPDPGEEVTGDVIRIANTTSQEEIKENSTSTLTLNLT